MKHVSDFRVKKVRTLQYNDFELFVTSDEELEEIFPGQFVNILVPNTQKTFLRRPISVCDVNYADGELRLYVRIVGDGTRTLSALKQGDTLNLLYPLGNSFTVKNVKNPLLVGGGCGIAPLLYLTKTFFNKNIRPTVLMGGQTAAALSWTTDFDAFATVYRITNDGSTGEQGLITQHSIWQNVNQFDQIYACGPEIMMKETAKLAVQKNIPCEVSLENVMACGIGACLCCVTETTQGNQCVCVDGPIFDVLNLKNFVK